MRQLQFHSINLQLTITLYVYMHANLGHITKCIEQFNGAHFKHSVLMKQQML